MKATFGPGVGAALTDDDRCDIADALPSWATADIQADHRGYLAVVKAPNGLSSMATGPTPIAAFDTALVNFEDELA